MRIEDCCSNISKAISVAALISSPCAIANTRTMEIAHFNTLADFTVKTKITGKLINTANTSRNFLVKPLTFAIADGFPIPRTEIGRKLLEHRRKALARGMSLLTANEINLMVKEGRGDFS